jgi:deoxyribodipyrimidine photo-lyase
MSLARPVIVWFRQDLRVADNPALVAAAQTGQPVLPVYLWSPGAEGDWPVGAASRYWLQQSLAALDRDLRARGSRLILRRGAQGAGRKADDAQPHGLAALVEETGATGVYYSHRYEPAALADEQRVERALAEIGASAEGFHASLLFAPATVANREGKPFRVFTPFWRHCLGRGEPSAPLAAPKKLHAPSRWPDSQPLASLNLEPRIDWAGGIRDRWTFGGEAAVARLERFVDDRLSRYPQGRDNPGEDAVSELSVSLHFGELSPRQAWRAVRARDAGRGRATASNEAETWLRQLVWREFGHHLLFHYPDTPIEPLVAAFRHFPWREDAEGLAAWREGRTGYPLVDAGMRELWVSGYMHNRVRMVAASFLVKDLLVHWLAGARWFWDTLLDADLANNTLGWQWTAGCGADAAPYFRVFNPLRQSERFDPAGVYIRRWLPELSALENRDLHAPWRAPSTRLRAAGVRLGIDYPEPLLDHGAARSRALDALERMKRLTARERNVGGARNA